MLTHTYSIREVGALELLNEAHDLLVLHREELTTDKELMVLDPHREGYAALDNAGAMIILAAYAGEELIGYSANILGPNLHYASVMMCQNDVLFIHPEHRGTSIGIRLIQQTEDLARLKGCNLMLWHAKPRTALDAILPRLGCRVQDVIWSKAL
jgi:predicted GNAT superfamily acetyltransferase